MVSGLAFIMMEGNQYLVNIIKEKKIEDWINVGEFKTFANGEYNQEADPYVHPNPWFRNTYDITSTPRIYILDKNKNIIANALKGNIPTEQISQIIKNHDSIKDYVVPEIKRELD